MSDILSQAEIEALLNSLQEEQSVTATDPAVPVAGNNLSSISAQSAKRHNKPSIAYEVYDFRRPDKFSKEQLRTLQMLHETFARHAATGLSAYLRSPVQIDLISLEQVPYEDYLRGINQSVFTVMSLPPLTGQAVLEVEFNLIFSMIDRLLGGPGRAINRAVLTDIERPLVKQMIERFFAALKTAWEGIVIVNPGIEQIETTSQFVQIAPPNDVVVTILFEVKIGSMRGAMSICVPYLVLKPITTKLSAQKWFVSNQRKHSNTHRQALSWQVKQAEVECCVLLGKTKVNIRDFLGLKEGDVIKLPADRRDDLQLLVSQQPKFAGRAGLDGKKVIFTVSDSIKDE